MKCELEHIEIEGLSICIPNTDNGKALNEQTSSDLAFQAASNILQNREIDVEKLGGLIFLSSTPDYRSPATAMVLQKRLDLPVDLIAFDVNISGNAFNQGVQLGHSVLNSSNSNCVMVLYGETPSKQMNSDAEQNDIFDYGSAVFLSKSDRACKMKLDSFNNTNLLKAIAVEQGGYKNAKPQGVELPYSGLDDPGVLHIDLNKVRDFQIEAMRSFSIYNKLNNSGSHLISNFAPKLIAKDLSKEIAEPLTHIGYRGAALQIQLQEIIENSEQKKLEIISLSYGEGLSASCLSFQISTNSYTSFIKSNLIFDEGSVSHEI